MIVTPENYVAVLKREEAVRQRSWEREDLTLNRARECKVPENLRPATPDDIVKYAIIWYPLGELMDSFWCVVYESMASLYPEYYIATDGSSYDLDGAYVEIE
jgi:hypothetical protein